MDLPVPVIPTYVRGMGEVLPMVRRQDFRPIIATAHPIGIGLGCWAAIVVEDGVADQIVGAYALIAVILVRVVLPLVNSPSARNLLRGDKLRM